MSVLSLLRAAEKGRPASRLQAAKGGKEQRQVLKEEFDTNAFELEGKVSAFKSTADNSPAGRPSWYEELKAEGTPEAKIELLEKVVRAQSPRFQAFNNKTGRPTWDDRLEGKGIPDGAEVTVVNMSPARYIAEAARILSKQEDRFISYDSLVEGRLRTGKDTIDELSGKMASGIQIDMPYLDYHTIGQEGLHRAIAARQLGVDKIPVVVMKGAKDADASAAVADAN